MRALWRAAWAFAVVCGIVGAAGAAALAQPSAPVRGSAPAAQPPGGSLLAQIRRLGVLADSSAMSRHGVIVKRKSLPKPRGAIAHQGRQTVGVHKRTVRVALPVTGRNWDGWPDAPLPQVGRIWRWDDLNQRWAAHCSGTVVSRELVLTAGHCVFDRSTGTYYKLLFVPGQTWNDPASDDPADIKSPYGTWPVDSSWVPGNYADLSGGPDWGLLYLGPQSGQYVGSLVGSYAIKTGLAPDVGQRIWLAGYPGEGFWATQTGTEGRGQYACDSNYTGRSQNGYLGGVVISVDCPMNGGASGGPWLFKQADGSWVIGGVSNTCEDDNTDDDLPGGLYCTPTSSRLDSLLLDARFLDFWNSVVPQLPTP
jgi:V8-like Glu-specific endopeptidase